MLKLSKVQHSFMWTYFQPQFYLRVYARVNHATVLHKRFRRCPRAPGSAELREGEHENKTGRNRPHQLLRAFYFRLPHYLRSWRCLSTCMGDWWRSRSSPSFLRAALSPLSFSSIFKKKKKAMSVYRLWVLYKKLGLEHVSNISQKTSNSLSDYQPKGYLKRHNLIHLFFNQAFWKFIIHKQRPRILQFLSYE